MKKLGIVMAGLLTAMTVYAQDPVPEAAPADATAPAEAAPVEEAAPADAAPVEETASAEAAPAEPAVADRKPWLLYGGYDRSRINFLVSTSDPASTAPPSLKTRFGGDSFTSDFNRFRFGTRLLEFIGFEAHFGFKGDEGRDPGAVRVDSYYGFYAVPTGVLFDMFEIGAVLGYSKMDLARGNAKETFKGVSYGLNTELPLRHFFESLPDIRVGLGGIVYHQKNDARIYGYNLGLRYDFKL